jgi:hypothetical protein
VRSTDGSVCSPPLSQRKNFAPKVHPTQKTKTKKKRQQKAKGAPGTGGDADEDNDNDNV